MKKETKKPQIAIYQVLGDEQKIRVRIEDENVWLTQKLIAELFGVDVRTVNEHLINIFLEQELDDNSVIRNFRITASDSKEYDTKHYGLEAILAVGYRVRSDRGTQFRKWATERLREYLIKGFTMDDERLKQGGGRARYFQELLQRVLFVPLVILNEMKNLCLVISRRGCAMDEQDRDPSQCSG